LSDSSGRIFTANATDQKTASAILQLTEAIIHSTRHQKVSRPTSAQTLFVAADRHSGRRIRRPILRSTRTISLLVMAVAKEGGPVNGNTLNHRHRRYRDFNTESSLFLAGAAALLRISWTR
jgi:hypothetical protein